MRNNPSQVSAGRLQQELRQSRPFATPQTEAFLNLVRTAGQLQHSLRQHLRPHGVTETQYNSLRILRGAGENGLTCSEIAERLVSRDPDITRLMSRLERACLVRRERDPKDRRIVLARITAKGLKALSRLDDIVTTSVQESFAHLSEKEVQTLTRLLERTRGPQA